MVNEILKLCMEKGFLLDKEMLELFSSLTDDGARNVINVIANLGIEERVINKRLFEEHFDKFRNLLIMDQGKDKMGNLFSGLGFTKDGEKKKE